MKLNISLLPKGAWNNDLSKTLPKKDWDILREFCYKKANQHCQICGAETDELDAHEVWEFDVNKKTQILKDIIGICTKCHGVIHFKNSVRLGYGEQAQEHFMKVNNCSEMEFSKYLTEALLNYEIENKVYRWKMIVDLKKFGGKNIEFNQEIIPMIKNPYENVEFDCLRHDEKYKLFNVVKIKNDLIGPPKIVLVDVDNYQGIITVHSLFTDRIEWCLDDIKIRTKYNNIGEFKTKFSVKDFEKGDLHFKLYNENGYIESKKFIIY